MLQEVLSYAKRLKQRLQRKDVREPEKGSYGNAYSLLPQQEGYDSDDRRRIHYRITDLGREYLDKITEEYQSFLSGMSMIMRYVETIGESGDNKD